VKRGGLVARLWEGGQGVSPHLRKMLRLNVRMHALGVRYRAEVPKKKRSMSVWLAFLRRHAPDLCGGKRA
jgi:hypothetical protein